MPARRFSWCDEAFDVRALCPIAVWWCAATLWHQANRAPVRAGFVSSRGASPYRADRGARYGSEWNASLSFPLATGLSGLVKVADYHADGFGRDSAKLWLQLEWRGQQVLASAR
jgi:hypothetical protein